MSDDKKLMAYAQEIFDHCVEKETTAKCKKCVFRGKDRVCVLNYPELDWDRNVFEVRE